MNDMSLETVVGNTNKSQIVATMYENDMQSDTLKLDPRVEQNMLISTGNNSSVPGRELENVCGAIASMDLGLAIHAVYTIELSQVMTNKIVKNWPNNNVNNVMMNECGTAASVDLGLAIHAVGTIELSQVMTNKTVKTGPKDDVTNIMRNETQAQGFGTEGWLEQRVSNW